MVKNKIAMPLIAVFMSLLMILGIFPAEIFAQVKFIPASEIAPQYITVDGENISIDDERIDNHFAVTPQNLQILSANRPNVSSLTAMSGDFVGEPTVTMNGRTVSAQRYIVTIDGVGYEAYCVDPQLRGPENSGAVYELTGEANPQLRNVLINGYPINSEWSHPTNTLEERLWWIYITRVAVAIAGNPSASFAGDSTVIQQATQLANGQYVADHDLYPAITVNGTPNAGDTGRTFSGNMARSQAFDIEHNRKTNHFYNSFRFEWDPNTPAGARLIVNGSVIATAPINPDRVFRDDISAFHIEMPNEDQFEGQEARVNLVGIHNQFANSIWVMQNVNQPHTWQDIAFLIPEVSASAVFSFEVEPEQDEASLRIIKRNPGGRGLAGAVFEITGPNGFRGTETTPSNGRITLTSLEPGQYTITETVPPPGYQLANPISQTVTIAPGSLGVIERVFVNPSELTDTPRVIIQKIDALTRENIPGALIRLRGMSNQQVVTGDGQLWQFDNTGINLSQVLTEGATTASGSVTSTVTDGVWSLEGLPYGFYMAEEERAPHNYSLLPQHTAYGFWFNPPDVTVALRVEETEVVIPWDDVLAMLQVLSGANTPAYDLQAVLEIMTAALGAVELVVIPVYDIIEHPNINSILITFENYPYGEIEVMKFDYVTGEPLAGAHIRIQGFFPEGNENGIPIERVGITDSEGRIIFDDLPAGNYTLSEIYAPPGYILGNDFQSVPLTWGQRNTVTFYNQPRTWLEVIKVDGSDGTRLAGARFELVDPTTGERWEAVSDNDGVAALGQAQGSLGNELVAGKTYILTELAAPNGYVLISEPISIVLRNTGINTITVENFRNPTLTIVKRDRNNGQTWLEGAVFEVVYENGQTVSGSPFTTDSNGEIIINEILFNGNAERTLIITEIIPPAGYNLSDPNRRQVTVRMGEDNVVVFENTRMPTLEIIKVDAVTGEFLTGAEFTIEKLEEPGKGMLTGNPFRTNENGRIILQYQYSGKYRIVETRAPNNYWLDPLQQNREWIIDIRDNEDYTLRAENTLLPTLIITKWNAVTYRPVPLAHFRIEYEVPNSANVQLVGEFVTNQNGQIVIPFTRVGWYRVTETRAAPGMSLNTSNNYRVYLSPGDNSYMPIPDVTGNNPGLNPQMPVFRDIRVFGGNDFFAGGTQQYIFPQNSIVIQGLSNETFTVANQTNAIMPSSLTQINVNSHIVGEFSADSSGIVVLEGLENATFTVTNSSGRKETAAHHNDGSVLHFNFTASSGTTDTNPEIEIATEFDGDIEIIDNPDLVEQFSSIMSINDGQQYWNSGHGIWNFSLNSIVIKKQDATNGNLLAGATFNLIYTTSGESGTRGTVVGTFTTGFSGIIVITGLLPGNYVIEEIQPPPNYTLSLNNLQNVNLKPDGTSIVEATFSNYPYGSLLITKIDSITRAPLAGAQFLVTDSRGTVVGTSNGLFTTDSAGNILIENLPPDSYIVSEQRAPTGYVIGSNATQTIAVQADGRVYRLEFTNDPLSSLIIRKIDSFDGSPLAGARFEVRRVNGEFIGEFTTDQQGLVTIPNLLGWFTVTEMEAPPGFAMDTDHIRTVEVRSQSPTYVTFYNPREGSLTITKTDNQGNPLSGAQFRVTRQNGEFVSNHTTGASGMINLSNLSAGWYFVEETQAPSGYVISQAGQSVEVRPNTSAQLTFVNLSQPTLTIQKLGESGNPLSGARFMVREIGGTFSREITIGAGGTASLVLPIATPQANFEIVETMAPQGYIITEPARVITVHAGENHFESFINHRTPSLVINKVDAGGNPLSGAVFEVRTLTGALIATATSNNGGVATVGSIEPGNYEIRETRAPSGYIITEQSQIVQISAGDIATVSFVNERLPALIIEKVDEQGNPLSGAEFEIRRLNGELVQRVTTNNGGTATIEQFAPGAYEIIETRAPEGYAIVEVSRSIQISAGETRVERFVNPRLATFVIQKINGDTNEPLAGVIFEITMLEGERIRNPQNNSFEFITDNAGIIRLPSLPARSYVAVETRALPGYIPAQPEVFVVGHDRDYIITIRNYKLPTYQILKIDGDDNTPLQGVVFEIAKYFDNGNSGERIRNPVNGSFEFVTDAAGLITLPMLPHATYIATEIRPLPGYIAAEPRIFVVGDNQDTTIIIRNHRQAELTIRKINSISRRPIEGVIFQISRPNGERIRNSVTGFYDFVTDERGMIYLPSLPDGTYWLTETRPVDGYIGLSDPVLIEINSAARQRSLLLEVENQPASGLLIIKTDAQTDRPLEGVVFDIRRADGSFVYGLIQDRNQPNTPNNSPDFSASHNGAVMGSFTTDHLGRIQINHLEPGVYYVTETRALSGYQLDTTVHTVTIRPGEQAILRVENAPLAGLRLLKIDAITQEPIYNVEFMVFDHTGSVVGNFYTDNNGLIDFSAILAPGRYTIRETRPAPGYSRDDVPRTVEFVAGQITEINWENVPVAGQLQILKISGDDNFHNGLPAGTPLAGAIFEIYEARTGNLVDRIISNERGMAVSKPLPLGRYIAREVAAPSFYRINPQEIHFEIEFESQIVRITFPNLSSNLGVSITKRGPAQAMQGHNIAYDIHNVRNDSTVPLADFYWRDILPVDAVRMDKLVTGTYNANLRYRILATTNQGNTIVVADNLSTLTNNVVEMRPVHLGLAANEYVVNFTLHFGQVPAGFTTVERPRIFVDVLSANQIFLPNGMMFANRVDVGGRVVGTEEWVIGNSTTSTTIFNPNRLPRSGF